MKKIVLPVSILLLLSIAMVFRFVNPVVAQETIYIRADGRVEGTDKIQRNGNVYTFTDNIDGEIIIQRNNIVVDGAGYTLQGTGDETGIYLNDRSKVSIQNTHIKDFEYGIYLRYSSSNNIYENQITNNDRGIYLRDSSNNNIISGNTITNNQNGIYFRSSSNNNIIYHNNFIDNSNQVRRSSGTNVWDNGYPSGGNYWSDFEDRYPDAQEMDNSGIWDTPYNIDGNNIDRYPLMSKWIPPPPPPDTTPPTISIISPENKTYSVTESPLTFTVSEVTSWIGYSLDDQAPVTIYGNTILIGLSEGPHTITVYASDTAGNTGYSDTIHFTIDTVAPNIEIVSPENKTYSTDSVSLIFTVNEPTSWIGYSLDGQANMTITGNTTLTDLSNGTHSLVVYARDLAENLGSSAVVYFTVDTSLLSITILQPENRTYDKTDVPLTFTVDKPVSWVAYSLDGQTNVTITGNTTLTLLDGMHYIVIYANDIAGNMGASSMVYFTVDTEAPTLSIISPTNTSYASTSVPLSFVVYGPPSWIGYSLDGQMNVTVSGNTTIVGLSEGPHTITVYASDTAGNTGYSDTIHFTIDTVAPNIEIVSPENKTYSTDSVSLIFTVNEPTSWIGYSLDGQANYTITGDTTLTGLPDGMHSLVVYARDLAENLGSSNMVYFTVDTTLPDTTLPIVSILSPENKTYSVTDVPLTFTVSELTSWVGYSLDGQANYTITGDTTLTGLPDGMHSLVVYARDLAENLGSSNMVYFTVDTTLSTVSVLSPENRTYDKTDVLLSCTVDESVSWMAYSLDGQTNVTITGNTTLSGLSKGLHSLIVYVRDTAGNTGASEIVYFTIEFQQPGPTQLWIVALITVIAGAGFAFTGYLAYDLLKTTTRHGPKNRVKRTS